MKRFVELPKWKQGIIAYFICVPIFLIFHYHVRLHTMLPFIIEHRHMPDNIVEAAQSNSVSQVRKFLDSGADVNSIDEYDQTPLSMAVYKENTSMIKLLLVHGADAYKVDKGGSSPMYGAITHACLCGKESSVRALIENGADVNGKDPITGFIPLHEMVVIWGYRHRPKELFLFLISKGADVNARDKKGIRPLGYAVGPRRADIAQLLKEHGAKM